jgi:hypothetical protein
MRLRGRSMSALWGILLLSTAGFMLLPEAGARTAKRTGEPLETLKPNDFGRAAGITNKWMPMKSGTRWIYEGSTIEDDGKIVPHRIEVTTTDLTKTVGGVCTTVSYDIDYTDNELVEAELTFYAQDNNGSVWLLGEYPEEYEDGKLTKSPAWIHGVQGARAGIMMQANPLLGTPSYSQGWAPAVGWTDRGVTYQMQQKVVGPVGEFDDVLVIKESARAEPDAEQLKYYAPGVGNVRVGWTGTKKVKEVLELIKVEQLDPSALGEIRGKALNLEKSAFKHSKNIYGRTTPVFCDDRCRGDRASTQPGIAGCGS